MTQDKYDIVLEFIYLFSYHSFPPWRNSL